MAPVQFEPNKLKPAQFTGIIKIPENGIIPIKLGQQVLIRLKTNPTQQYGTLTGRILYIADEPDEHRLFTLKVLLNRNGTNP